AQRRRQQNSNQDRQKCAHAMIIGHARTLWRCLPGVFRGIVRQPACRAWHRISLTRPLYPCPFPGMRRAHPAALFACLVTLSLLALPPPALAQKPARAETPAQVQGISPEQARQALEVLNDPARRAAFAATLNAIAKAPAAPAVGKPPRGQAETGKPAAGEPAKPEDKDKAAAPQSPLPIPLAPDSLGAQVLVSASG